MAVTKLLFKGAAFRLVHSVAGIVVGLFMLPFLVGELGNELYGIWTVIGSLVASYFLLDMGLTSAVTRFLVSHLQNKDVDAANKVINTSLLIFSLIGLVVFIIAIILSLNVSFFVDNEAYQPMVALVLIITGINLALEFPFNSFAGVTIAKMRYDLVSAARFIAFIVDTTLIVIMINLGFELIAIASVNLFSGLISRCLFFMIAKREYPEMRFSLSYLNKETFHTLIGYSSWSFLINVVSVLRSKVDIFIIGMYIGASTVTIFYIGLRIVDLLQNLLYKATNLFFPLFTQYYEKKQFDEINKKIIFLNKFNALLSCFAGGLLFVFGDEFINLWMGNGYHEAYLVLLILLTGKIIEFTNSNSCTMLYVAKKHNFLAKCDMLEACANVALTIYLIEDYGLIGIAIGTAVPQLFMRLFTVPLYTMAISSISKKDYYLGQFSVYIYSGVYFLACYLINSQIGIVEYDFLTLILLVSLFSPLYLVLAFFFIFTKEESRYFLSIIPEPIKKRLPKNLNPS